MISVVRIFCKSAAGSSRTYNLLLDLIIIDKNCEIMRNEARFKLEDTPYHLALMVFHIFGRIIIFLIINT